MIPLLLAQLEDRLRSHTDRAETAHVAEQTTRCPKNCRHSHRLSNGSYAFTARRWGDSEQEAATCSDTKALACPGFTPSLTEDELRAAFRSMPEAELGLRWNSINELRWIRRQILDQMEPHDRSSATPSVPAPTPVPATQI